MICRDLRHLFRITQFMRSEKPDLVYCDGAKCNFLLIVSRKFSKNLNSIEVAWNLFILERVA